MYEVREWNAHKRVAPCLIKVVIENKSKHIVKAQVQLSLSKQEGEPNLKVPVTPIKVTLFDKIAKDVIYLVKIDPTKPFFDDITDLSVDILECTAERDDTAEEEDETTQITAASNMDAAYDRQGGNNNDDLVNNYQDDDETDVFQVINTATNNDGDNDSNQSFGQQDA